MRNSAPPIVGQNVAMNSKPFGISDVNGTCTEEYDL
jgi:hypothetical protein